MNFLFKKGVSLVPKVSVFSYKNATEQKDGYSFQHLASNATSGESVTKGQ